MTLAPQRRESAKERSLRIPLDYVHQPDRLVRFKWQASALLVLLAVGYVAAIVLLPRWGRLQASPGGLSAAHASFHEDCRACHQQPLTPLRSDAVDLAHWADAARSRQVAEGGCLRCHPVSGHHASAPADEVPRCAACHREHQGAAADLRRTADLQCTRCHAAIASHRQGDSQLSPALANVTAFAGGDSHPSFRSLASGDPGNIRFNHWLHLQPGIAPASSQRKLRTADLPPGDRPRYTARADGLVQLACADCHAPDPRTGGAHMRPIAYAEHCQACHPLHVAIQPDGPPIAVPHGLDRASLAALLDGLLIAQPLAQPHMDTDPPATGAQRHPPTASAVGSADDLPLVPGRTLGRNLAQRLAADLLRQRNVAVRAVTGRCLQCHLPRPAATASGSGEEGLSELPELAPAAIPSRWLVHSRFDHAAHQHLACRECHAAAYRFEQPEPAYVLSPPPQDARLRPARDADEVMIADRDTCLRCHTPRREGQGGARHDCTQCHDYHGGALRLSRLASPQAATPWKPSPVRPATIEVRSVSQTGLRPAYVDERSCAAAGCHGSTRPDASVSARAAMIWLTRDPHREAEELLWTQRARQMTARLTDPATLQARALPIREGQSSVNRAPVSLSDEEHARVLAQRCVGCHAPAGENHARASPLHRGDQLSAHRDPVSAAAALTGVGCQACHGPASNWLHTHYRRDFDRKTLGFLDTKSLSERAAACMPCHVGPAPAGEGAAQAVDHDLIAAGHPRLAFDFFGYFQSLPAHWDTLREQEKYSGFYHFALWQAGHDAEVVQEKKLEQWFWEARRDVLPAPIGVPEFSLIDCQACHHALAYPVERPSPTLWRPRVVSLSLDWLPDAAPLTLDDRLEAAARALESVAIEKMTYDTACRMYSLVRAVAADVATLAGSDAATVEGSAKAGGRVPDEPDAARPAVHAALASAVAAAGDYLARESFPAEVWAVGGPTLYDGPTKFVPSAWSRHRDALVAALRQVRQSLAQKRASSEARGR